MNFTTQSMTLQDALEVTSWAYESPPSSCTRGSDLLFKSNLIATVLSFKRCKGRRVGPNQWVLVEELKSHYEGDKVCIDEVAVIRAIHDAKEATDELFAAKEKRFVYHTAKDRIVIREIQKPMIRRNFANET